VTGASETVAVTGKEANHVTSVKGADLEADLNAASVKVLLGM